MTPARSQPSTSRPSTDQPSTSQPSLNQPPGWTFLTNHAHVLICLARQPGVTLREVALRVGVTERAVQRIVAELEKAGALVRGREGRRNRYRVTGSLRLRHPIEAHRSVQDLLDMVGEEGTDAGTPD